MINLVGTVFDSITVDHYVGSSMWACTCECGVKKHIRGDHLRQGRVKSCGCKRGQLVTAIKTTHGLSHEDWYNSWQHMVNRCTNTENDGYADYGGRGISVCERWLDPKAFFEDMGERPTAKHSIERENVNGNYEPGNCVWATAHVQTRNTRRSVHVTCRGVTKVMTDWAKDVGISAALLRYRIKVRGLPVEDVLFNGAK